MRRQSIGYLIGALCLSLLSGYPARYGQAQAQAKKAQAQSNTAAAKITVLNPLGNPPPIKLIPMAVRSNSLDGKTVYFVDDGFLGGDLLLKEMIAWFAKNQPGVKTQFRKKAGGFTAEDPALWAEIKDKGDAMVMATGH